MSVATHRVALLMLAAVAGSACIGDLDVDEVPWACTSNAQCGWRAQCIDSVCVLVDSQRDTGDTQAAGDSESDVAGDTSDTPEVSEPTGFSCNATLLSPEPDKGTNFDVFWDADAGRWKITVTLEGLTATYDLPADVVLPDLASPEVGPLLECCENPCCPPLP